MLWLWQCGYPQTSQFFKPSKAEAEVVVVEDPVSLGKMEVDVSPAGDGSSHDGHPPDELSRDDVPAADDVQRVVEAACGGDEAPSELSCSSQFSSSVELFCVCRKPYDASRWMLQVCIPQPSTSNLPCDLFPTVFLDMEEHL